MTFIVYIWLIAWSVFIGSFVVLGNLGMTEQHRRAEMLTLAVLRWTVYTALALAFIHLGYYFATGRLM